jgi:hypothetical protein
MYWFVSCTCAPPNSFWVLRVEVTNDKVKIETTCDKVQVKAIKWKWNQKEWNQTKENQRILKLFEP